MSNCSEIIKDGTLLIKQIRQKKRENQSYRLLHSNKQDLKSIRNCLKELRDICYSYKANGKSVTLDKENKRL